SAGSTSSWIPRTPSATAATPRASTRDARTMDRGSDDETATRGGDRNREGSGRSDGRGTHPGRLPLAERRAAQWLGAGRFAPGGQPARHVLHARAGGGSA